VPHYELPDGGVKIPAAWLIEQCGLKGAELGEAAVYHKQPLVIINKTGSAKPQDIIALEQKIIDSVKAKFGIELSPEVEHI
jgi:UDP-N-acetylmuramate dehydrogenase